MTIGMDTDKGLTDPYVIIRIMDEDEGGELIAFFTVPKSVAVPDAGETLFLRSSTAQNGEINTEDYGTYRVSERHFSYDVLQERVVDEEEQPDRLFAVIELSVTSVDQ